MSGNTALKRVGQAALRTMSDAEIVRDPLAAIELAKAAMRAVVYQQSYRKLTDAED